MRHPEATQAPPDEMDPEHLQLVSEERAAWQAYGDAYGMGAPRARKRTLFSRALRLTEQLSEAESPAKAKAA